jgi:hypothetical protein
MKKPEIVIIDVAEGTEIIREMTEDEFASYSEALAADEAKQKLEMAEKSQKESTKSALLKRLGITEDEAKLLLA